MTPVPHAHVNLLTVNMYATVSCITSLDMQMESPEISIFIVI